MTLFGFADSGAGPLRWVALAAYAGAVLLALSLYLPRKWPFNVARDLERTIDDLPIVKVHYDLALAYQRQVDQARLVISSSDSRLPSFRIRFSLLVLAAALTVGFGAASVAAAKPAPDEPTRIVLVRE